MIMENKIEYCEEYYKYRFDSYIHRFMWRGECSFHGAEYKEEIHFAIFKRVNKIKRDIFLRPYTITVWEECFFETDIDRFKSECRKYLKLHRLGERDVYGLDLSDE